MTSFNRFTQLRQMANMASAKSPATLLLLTANESLTSTLKRNFDKCASELSGQVFVHHLPGLLTNELPVTEHSLSLPDQSVMKKPLQEDAKTLNVSECVNVQKSLHASAAAKRVDLIILSNGFKPGLCVYPKPSILPDFVRAYIGPDEVPYEAMEAYKVSQCA